MKKLHIAFWLWMLSLVASVPVGASEIARLNKVRATVGEAFRADNFAAIDTLADQFRNTKSRSPSGFRDLSALYLGLEQAMAYKPVQGAKPAAEELEVHWAAVETRTNTWIARFPASPVAPIAHSMALLQHGWSFRGTGMASTVTPRGQEQFARHVALSLDTLEKNKNVSSIDPHWYSQMLAIAKIQGWNPQLVRAIFDEGSGKDPLFYPVYIGVGNYLSPLWGGSYEQVEAFADSAVLRTESTEGKSMYARIFRALYQSGATGMFRHKSIWPKMKMGFEDLLVRYPDDWHKHGYARYACAAGDLMTARRLFKEIGDTPWEKLGNAYRLEAWGPTFFEACRAWMASYPQ